MPTSSSSSPAQRSVDVRTLSLAQLQKLTERGSRRARVELEGRLRATETVPRPAVPIPPVTPAASPRAPAGPIPALSERAALAATDEAPPPPSPHDAMVQQLAMIARQDEARARADGPPRLVGMVLMAWGVLLLLGGLVMLSHGGGLYYLFCGAGSAAVGWLLLQCSRWAMALHGALLLLALAWAWQASQSSLAMALVQAAPLWIAALWLAVPAVREPLE